MSNNLKTVGALAQFSNPGELMKAAKKLRDSEYNKFDCHSPFPIHGMDKAMGLPLLSLRTYSEFMNPANRERKPP